MTGSVSANMEKDDRILLAGLEDRIRQADERYMITHSGFLDMRQRSLAEQTIRRHRGLTYGFYGGYDDAERVVGVFFPEGFLIGIDASEHFRNYPEDDPLTVIRAELKKGASKLTHRDYLGALMGLGIRREMTGDIVVRENGADIIVLKEVADFLLMNYSKAGRASLHLREVAVTELIYTTGVREETIQSVASLRLDNVVSVAFGISRSKAGEAIAAGLIFVNGISEKRLDRIVKEGEKIVFRGKGKTVLREVRGKSSKGRTMIAVEKYK